MSVLASVFATRPSMRGFRVATILLLSMAVVGLVGMIDSRIAGAADRDRHDLVEAFERDVYVIVGSTLRNPTDTTADDAPLFNVAGVALNRTWGQWKAATAKSFATLVTTNVVRTRVTIRMTGLVPNGVYSVFWGTLNPDSEHPGCPGVERTLPVKSVGTSLGGPDRSSFVADASGDAIFKGKILGDWLQAQQAFLYVIYHSDGETYHPFPNAGEFTTHDGPSGCRSSFGEDAMRQLVIFQKF